jgi:hypothetical protein
LRLKLLVSTNDCEGMEKPEDITAVIHGTRINDMRALIEVGLPSMLSTELYDEWLYSIVGGARFAADLPWLNLLEAEYERR